MAALEPTDTILIKRNEQSDVPVYMPGTPTLSFTTHLERIVDALFR